MPVVQIKIFYLWKYKFPWTHILCNSNGYGGDESSFTFTFTTIQARPLYEAYVLGSVNVQDQITTPGTPCPTLHEWCVGSLTSHSYLQQGLWDGTSGL